MPVIQQADPFAAGVNAVNDWMGGQNDAKEKAAALARAKQKDDLQQANFNRTQGHTESVDAQTAARQDRLQAHNEAEDKTRDAASAHLQKLADQLQPYLIKQYQLSAQASTDAHAAAAVQLVGNRLKNKMDEITVKYGPQMAQAALAQAHATTAHENAATQHEFAATAHENAETGLTEQYTKNLASGLTKTGGTRGSAADRLAAAQDARTKLPPVIQGLLSQIEGGQTNAAGVRAYVQGNPQYRQLLPIVDQILATKGAVDKASAADIKRVGDEATSARGDLTRPNLERSPAFQKVPAQFQAAILKAMKSGIGIDAIRSQLDASTKISPEDKALVDAGLADPNVHAASAPAAAAAAIANPAAPSSAPATPAAPMNHPPSPLGMLGASQRQSATQTPGPSPSANPQSTGDPHADFVVARMGVLSTLGLPPAQLRDALTRETAQQFGLAPQDAARVAQRAMLQAAARDHAGFLGRVTPAGLTDQQGDDGVNPLQALGNVFGALVGGAQNFAHTAQTNSADRSTAATQALIAYLVQSGMNPTEATRLAKLKAAVGAR
jgi:hypothetical protein